MVKLMSLNQMLAYGHHVRVELDVGMTGPTPLIGFCHDAGPPGWLKISQHDLIYFHSNFIKKRSG